MQGPSELELRSLAEDGSIVVFNVSDIRSDAFIVTTDEIRALSLPLLRSDALEEFSSRFLTAISNRSCKNYEHSITEVNATLEWLWDVAVCPILEELGFTQSPPNEAWPRVWWIGNGLLNILPIHASGYHDSATRKTSLDRVISSYASTMKSLSYARERAERANRLALKEKAILVAMPTTPGQKTLPNVDKEIREIENLFSRVCLDATSHAEPDQTLCTHRTS